MTNREEYYFNKAKQISRISTYDRVRIGCIAVYRKNIIGIGYNQAKTNPMQIKYSIYRNECGNLNSINNYLHAEMACVNQIKNLDIDFSKVKLFIYREDDAHNNTRICKPCGACERAIRDLGIRTVYYTDTNKYIREDYK